MVQEALPDETEQAWAERQLTAIEEGVHEGLTVHLASGRLQFFLIKKRRNELKNDILGRVCHWM